MITHRSLDHLGGYYHYRIHNPKTKQLCANGLQTLNSYLKDMLSKCPHKYFESGPRSSSLKFPIQKLSLFHTKNHEVSALAKGGLKENQERYLTNHSRVQMFMLENDNKTIAVEVPLWLEVNELEKFQDIFKSTEPLTGHIDLVRIEDNKIWIWDYKPNAKKEKFAATQVYFYAYMLSKRTGVDLEKFMCGYFDDKDSYIFKPKKEIIADKQLSALFDFL